MEKIENEFINIDEIEGISRDKFHRKIASVIAEDNLKYINEKSEPVRIKQTIYSKYVKRLLDVIISAIVLFLTMPINLIIGICTFVSLGRPLFFQEYRVGKDGKYFKIIKFRNMTMETDSNGELLPPSKRVTKLGKFFRKTSLDELLNFWSILKGDMSIIGPRPLQPVYVERYSKRHRARDMVKPGLECPMLKELDHAPSWCEQFENDIYYIENISFLTDLKQCFNLIKMVFDKKTRTRNASCGKGGFMGYSKIGESISSKKVPRKYVEIVLSEWEKEK